jgi:hypothetical protein
MSTALKERLAERLRTSRYLVPAEDLEPGMVLDLHGEIAELIRLQEIIHDEIEAGPDDPIRKWFDSHTADEFAAGVVVPTDFIGEFGELLESDWFDEAMKVEKERESMIADLEAKDG